MVARFRNIELARRAVGETVTFFRAFVLLVVCLPAPLSAQGFDPGCPLSFAEIATEDLEIDANCGPEGEATSPPHRSQNAAKNNLCAPAPAARVTFHSFTRLQRIAEQRDIPFGSSNQLPPDRAILRDLHKTTDGNLVGEGDRVALAGFIVKAHHSNVSKGESVNCKRKGWENNDIHISIGKNSEADACDTVTAEISPHFRPAAWDPIALNHLTRPVRVIGHLFFDASHKPCPGTPARYSIWEIHPVYQLDVCQSKTLKNCRANDDQKWVPLHEWLGTEEEDE
jgi:hypothetical protein